MKQPIEANLFLIVPVLIAIIGLAAAILFLPQENADVRSRASEAVPLITPPPSATPTEEIFCSSLYEPVCGDDGQTYSNPCEAGKAGVTFVANPCE